MDPREQMRWGALLALLTIALPFLASLLAGVLEAAGVSRDVLEPAFRFLVPLMLLVFVAGVALAVAGFIRRGRLPPPDAAADDETW